MKSIQSRSPRWAAVGAILCLIAALPARAETEEKTLPPRAFGSLGKSLLVPGWGQIAEKRYIEAALFLGAEAACLWQIFRHNKAGNDAYALYRVAATADDAVRYRRDTERADARRNRALLAAGAVWAVNLLDITLIVKHKDAGRGAVALRIVRDAPREIGLSLSCRF